MNARPASEGLLRVAVAGAAGRMGRAVLELAAAEPTVRIAAALVREESPLRGTPCAAGFELLFTHGLEMPCDALIDFSTGGTEQWLGVCSERRIPMVIGSTGLSQETLGRIHDASRRIAIVHASNFSAGIQAALRAIAVVVQALGSGYDVEMVEKHHRHKKDAPSGTAIAILDELCRSLGSTADTAVVHGRFGEATRTPGQIGVHSLRMGDVVGEHEVHFSGFGETLTIRHVAQSRRTFAAGALRAARWAVGRPAGRYSMADVLACPSGAKP